MSLSTRIRIGLASAALAMTMLVPAAHAQAISETHMKAARAAVAAINATAEYDAILPQSAIALKEQLIQQNPDQQELIEKTVNEKVLAMVSRRADLEKEAANAFAKVFSEEELNAIATFYTSPAGKKLLADGPVVTREVIQAANVWQRGIARDLALEVSKVVGATTGAAPITAPDGSTDAPATPPAQP